MLTQGLESFEHSFPAQAAVVNNAAVGYSGMTNHTLIIIRIKCRRKNSDHPLAFIHQRYRDIPKAFTVV